MGNRVRLITLAGVLVAWQSGFAADEPSRPKEVRDLIDSTLAAPPELAADMLLHIGDYITDPVWKRELIERAWELAPGATWPSEIGVGAVGAHSDTDAWSLSDALSDGVSKAGIQSARSPLWPG